MKKYIPYILSAYLIAGFTFLVPEIVFSQTGQGEIKMDETDSLTIMNEEGCTNVKGITTGRAVWGVWA